MIRLPRAAQEPHWFQAFRQGLERALRSQPLSPFTVATLPDPVAGKHTMIVVTDEVGGPTLAWSDGSDWRRTTDNAVVS